MESYRVVLFGNRCIPSLRKLEDVLYPMLRELTVEKPYVEFYIGRNGDFDIFAASIIKRVQNAVGRERSEMTLVLPYPTKDLAYYEQYYDRVMIPDTVTGIHPKRAIEARNRWMVAQCDLLICYAAYDHGGAYAALQYAKRLQKRVINLVE